MKNKVEQAILNPMRIKRKAIESDNNTEILEIWLNITNIQKMQTELINLKNEECQEILKSDI